MNSLRQSLQQDLCMRIRPPVAIGMGRACNQTLPLLHVGTPKLSRRGRRLDKKPLDRPRLNEVQRWDIDERLEEGRTVPRYQRYRDGLICFDSFCTVAWMASTKDT